METTFLTPDIECTGCASSIKRALNAKVGIERVDVDVDAKTVAVAFDQTKTNRESIAEALTDIGFVPEEM